VQQPSKLPLANAHDLQQLLTLHGQQAQEQQQDASKHHYTPLDAKSLLGTQQEANRQRMCFSLHQGFLKALKPPIGQLTPLLRQHHHNSSTNLGHKQTPRAVTTVSQLPVTTEPCPEQSSFLQGYDLCLDLRGTDGTTHSKWEGVTNLLIQMQAIHDTIQVWPWAVKD